MLTDKNLVRKMNLEHLSASECEKILQVLQKDFELRQKEKTRLEKIEEDIKEEDNKADVLAKKTKLNENVCIRCCQTFGIIFNRKQTCNQCLHYVCKSCCARDMEKGGFVCNACIKEHELKLKSCDWFYNNVSKRFKRFGSAKIVRTLYKQRGDCKSRRFHSDNESDSGYDPSLFSSFKSGTQVVRQRPSLVGVFHAPMRESRDDSDDDQVLEPVLPPPPLFDTDLFKPPPPPIVITPIQTANEKPPNDGGDTQNQDDQSRDIYKEALHSARESEGKKFEARFSGLLSELHLSLKNQSPNGVTCNTSYGGVLVTYTNRLREMLVGVSQRLELAIDSFDSVPNQSTEATSDKVRHLVSKLVENGLGESIDLTSDEAVSDLSSLSDEESDGHKSFEDQLAQAVIAKVLENHRKDTGLQSLRHDHHGDVIEERGHKDSVLSSSTVDQGHGDSLQNSDTDQGQAESLHDDDTDNLSAQSSLVQDVESVKEFREVVEGHQNRAKDCGDYVSPSAKGVGSSDSRRSEEEIRDQRTEENQLRSSQISEGEFGGHRVHRGDSDSNGYGDRSPSEVKGYQGQKHHGEVIGHQGQIPQEEVIGHQGRRSQEEVIGHQGRRSRGEVIGDQGQRYQGEIRDYQGESNNGNYPDERFEGEDRVHEGQTSDNREFKGYPDRRSQGEVIGHQNQRYYPDQRFEGEDRVHEGQTSDREFKGYSNRRSQGEVIGHQGQRHYPDQRNEGEDRVHEGQTSDREFKGYPNRRPPGEVIGHQGQRYYPDQRFEGEDRVHEGQTSDREFKGYPDQRSQGEVIGHQGQRYYPDQRNEGEDRVHEGQTSDREFKGYPNRRPPGEVIGHQGQRYYPDQRFEGEDRVHEGQTSDREFNGYPNRRSQGEIKGHRGQQYRGEVRGHQGQTDDRDFYIDQSFQGNLRSPRTQEKFDGYSNNERESGHDVSDDFVDGEEVIEDEFQIDINTTQESVNPAVEDETPIDDPNQEIKKLKSFLSDISPRPNVRPIALTEEECDIDEPLIQPESVNREESQLDFLTKCTAINYAHEHTASLPDFDFSDFELNSNEIDPDLLSMNLAPILEEDEDNYIEELDEEEDEEEDGGASDWRRNWIFKGNSSVSPYANMGKKHVGSDLGQIYMTIPEPYQDMAPRVGNRSFSSVHTSESGDASEIFSDLSDNEDQEDNLSDEETSFYSKTSEEIARITRKTSFTQSVQTDDSDLDSSRDQYMSDSGVKVQSSKVNKGESSADDSMSTKKLIEELVPAEGDDPKFEIPPESVMVPEGEPAKFTCRVAGTDPTDVFWYKVEDELKELEDSQQFELSREGSRHHLTMYYPVKADVGQYMAIAVNEKGRCCQYLVLKIKKNTQDLKAPEFLKGIQDQEVMEGQAVKFRCKVKGYPQPRVVWYKDGQMLKSQMNCKIEKYGNRDYLMTIDCATMDDDAEYTVSAKNVAGEVKSSAQLIVEPDQPDVLNATKTSLSFSSSLSSSFSDEKKKRPWTEDQQISNLGRKMMVTKNNVTDVAEDMLSTANELSALHTSLDQVDFLLSNFERDIYSANTCIHDDRYNNNVADNFLARNLYCATVENYRQLKNAAENVRHVTSSSLSILNTTKDAIDSEKEDDGCLATSTPREESEVPSFNSRADNSNKNLDNAKTSQESTVHQNKWYNSLSYPVESYSSYVYPNTQQDSSKPNVELENSRNDVVSRTEKMAVQSEVLLPPSFVDDKSSDSQSYDPEMTSESFRSVSEFDFTPTPQQDAKPQQHEVPQVAAPKVKDTPPPPPKAQTKVKVVTVVNTGPKKLDDSQFKRDYFVNVTPKMSRKHWDVKTSYTPTSPPVNRDNSLEDTEEKIYMTAGKVYDLEETVDDLRYQVDTTDEQEKDAIALLEDAVAQTVADVHCSEQDVSSIESSVSQIKLRALPTTIIGQTIEAELPESRTELNMESGLKELPSVNRLKAMFSNPADDASVKRVHSITARTVPKEKLERFRRGSSSDKDDSTDDQHIRKSHMTVNLSPAPKITSHDEPTQVFPETKGATFPASVPKRTPPTTTVTSRVQVKAKAPSPLASKPRETAATPTSQPTAATTGKPAGEKKTTPRIRSGCIAARANFWEKKIQDPEDQYAEEFPDMVVDVQEDSS